jgi:hypothetical protein
MNNNNIVMIRYRMLLLDVECGESVDGTILSHKHYYLNSKILMMTTEEDFQILSS